MDKSSSNKRARLSRADAYNNRQSVLALASSGLTQAEIASKLGLSKKTVYRHVQAVKPTIESARNIVHDVADELAKIRTPADIARNLANLSEHANNDAVKLGAEQFGIELRGGVTERERLRRNQAQEQQPQAMFILPAGAKIDFGGVTINQANTTISSNVVPDNGASCRNLDVPSTDPQESQ